MDSAFGARNRHYSAEKRVNDNSLELGKQNIICDIGCATGSYTYILSDQAKCVIGLEIERKFIKEAVKVCKFKQNTFFIVACGEYLPIKDTSLDSVAMFEVIEHVNNPELCISQVRNALKDRGVLRLTAPNQFYPFECHGMRIRKTLIKNFTGIGIPFLSWMPSKVHSTFGNARIYNQRQLFNIIEKCGLTIHHLGYMMPPLDRLIANTPLKTAVQQTIRRIGSIMERIPFIRCFGVHVTFIAVR